MKQIDKMRNILITGGAGFIGSNLTDLLLKRGYQVTCFDNLSSGSLENISRHFKNKRFSFVEGNLEDTKLLEKVVSGKDIVFHLAAILGVSEVVKRPLDVFRVDYASTHSVLEAARKAKVGKVYLASSSEVYGKNPKMPLREDSERVYGPTDVSRWSYATAKSMAEHLFFSYKEKYGLPVAIGRYFNIYGPGCYNKLYRHVITKFTLQALGGDDITIYGNGLQKRSFFYIDDAIRATYQIVFQTSGEAFNIGSRNVVSMIKLARMIKRLTKSNSKIVHQDPKDILGKGYEDALVRVPDTTKVEKWLHFYPKVDLEAGLKKTIRYLSSLRG